MADKRIYELTEASTVGSSDVLALDSQNMAATKKVKVKTITDPLSNKNDISSLILTGSTNTTGGTIEAGRYFYLDGDLVIAKTNIAAGATFTPGTNYVLATVGGELTDVKQTLSNGFVKTGSVSVTADGTKTYSELIAQLYIALGNIANALASNQKAEILYILNCIPTRRVFWTKSDKPTFGASLTNFIDSVSPHYVRIMSLWFNSSGGSYFEVHIPFSGSPTSTTLNSVIPTSGTALSIHYNIYTE